MKELAYKMKKINGCDFDVSMVILLFIFVGLNAFYGV